NMDNGLRCAPFMHHQPHKSSRRNDGEVPDPWCLKPIGTLTTIHHQLAQSQRQHHQGNAKPVGSSTTLEDSQVSWVVNERRYHEPGSNSDGNVNIEVPTPVIIVSDLAAY